MATHDRAALLLPSFGFLLVACGAGGATPTQVGSNLGDGNQVGNGNQASIVTTASTVTPSGANSGKYVKLTWSDEFSGTVFDTNKWSYEVNCDGGGNNEDECYTLNSNNVFVDGQGNLVIRVIKQSGLANGKTYTSGRITSSGKGDFTYARWEARIQVPAGQGFWPAFWTMPTDNSYGGWPTSGELDIMEILGGNPNTLYGTAHYGVPSPYTQSGGQATANPNFSSGFHVYALEREEHQIRWYVDQNLYYTLNDNSTSFWPSGGAPADGTAWPFTKRYFTILNMAMGGNWPGAPDASIKTGDMQVDYVRVFE